MGGSFWTRLTAAIVVPLFISIRSKYAPLAVVTVFHVRHSRKSWMSSGITSSSTLTPFSSSRRFEIHGLMEIHVAIVVSVNEQDRRFPRRDRGDRRRLERDLQRLPQIGFVMPSPAIARACMFGVDGPAIPVVDAVDVHAGGEHVGVAAERERRQVAAVRSAPDADARADRRRRASADSARRRARRDTRTRRARRRAPGNWNAWP